MGYVYRYTDIADGIVKYVGIVSSENRTLLQRVKEHQTYDDWCNGSQWKIEYLEINNKTDCLVGIFPKRWQNRKSNLS